MNRLRIAVCYEPPVAGSSADLQDILYQVSFLKQYIPHDVILVPYTGDIAGLIKSVEGVDVVWNLFETFNGREDQQYLGAALLELAGKKYTGAKLESLVISADKCRVKSVLAAGGVSVPQMYAKGCFHSGRWIVKPSKLHGSVGINDLSLINASDESNLIAAINAKPELELFAEQYIDGDEYSAALIDMGGGLNTLAVAHMQFKNHDGRPNILGFNAKWNEDSDDYHYTERTFDVDNRIRDEISFIADKASRMAGLEGFARIDFRIGADGTPYVIDVNPNPGLGVESGFIAACLNAGLNIEKSLDYIIQAAVR